MNIIFLTTALSILVSQPTQAIDIILINDEENGATSWAAREDHRKNEIKRYNYARLVCSIGRDNQIPLVNKDIFLSKGKGTAVKDTLPWTQDFDILNPLRLIIKFVINENGAVFTNYLSHEVLKTSTYGPNDKITVHFKGIEKDTRFRSFIYELKHDAEDTFVSELDGLRAAKVRQVDTVREADTLPLKSASADVPPPTAELEALSLNEGASPQGGETTED